MKEIGVRKVLGASVGNIMLLFSKAYLKLLIVAFVIGIPLANYVLSSWMDNFAFKGDIAWPVYFVPAILVTVLAFLAVSFEIMKAALKNPVNSLRCE